MNIKKILYVVLLSATAVISGCYDSNSATVRINLGNMPVAHNTPKSFTDRVLGIFERDANAAIPRTVSRIHIAAYSGDSIVASLSVDANNITNDAVEIDVPAGDDIKVLVIGANTQNTAEYFGIGSAELKPGQVSDVTIPIYTISYWDTSSIIADFGATTISWNGIGIKVKYLVEATQGSTGPVVRIYEGYETQFSVPLRAYSAPSLYIMFEEFDCVTSEISVN